MIADVSTLRLATWNCGGSIERVLDVLLQYADAENMDVVALEEVGTPTSLYRRCIQAGYHLVIGPAPHAGTAFLIKENIWAYKRKHESYGGRLLKVHFDFPQGSFLLICVYMPAGLDFLAVNDESFTLATELHAKLLDWCSQCSHCLVVGDFNETLSTSDRSGSSPYRARLVPGLSNAGFVDCFLSSAHALSAIPAAPPLLSDRYTYVSQTVSGTSYSRIDYIFAKGWPVSDFLSCSVRKPTVAGRNYHRILALSLACPALARTYDSEKVQYPVPNLRKCTEEQKQMFVDAVVGFVSSDASLRASANGSRSDVDHAIDLLTGKVHSAAVSYIGLTGSRKPFASRARKDLERKRTILVSLSHVLVNIVDSQRTANEIVDHDRHVLLRRAVQARKVFSAVPVGLTISSSVESLRWVTDQITEINKQIRAEKSRMYRERNSESRMKWNGPAFVRSMLRGDEPAHISSVVDPDSDRLVAEPAEVKRVLHDHFAHVFSDDVKAGERANEPAWVKDLYAPKANVKDEWFKDLMNPCHDAELRMICADNDWFAAPGEDGVGAGLWRLLIDRSDDMCELICSLLSRCLALRMCPRSGKSSVIVPIPKKLESDKTVSNIRPISLQSAFTKILTKVLARRLGSLLVAHHVLHPAQEAFLIGGGPFKCVDLLLDVWEIAKQKKRGCYNLFYDIAAAYDSVRHDDLLRALARLHLPNAFLIFVKDSLSDLESCVRTDYGLTAKFSVQKSVRQGDPLAPLLYVCFMDPLHCGLDHNPLYGGRHDGFVVNTALSVASEGFADDTLCISETFDGLLRLNDFMMAFCAVNHLRVNAKKSVLVGRQADGSCMTNSSLKCSGELLIVTPLEKCIIYLGVPMCMDLDWSDAKAAVTRLIGYYAMLANKYTLSVNHTVYFLNMFLIPKIDKYLRVVDPSPAEAHHWDTLFVRAICRSCNAAYHMKNEAVAFCTGLLLPSYQEKLIKLSEAFLRLNGTSRLSVSSRARWLAGGWAVGRSNMGVAGIENDERFSSSKMNRLVCVRSLAHSLGWELKENMAFFENAQPAVACNRISRSRSCLVSARVWGGLAVAGVDRVPAGAVVQRGVLDGIRFMLAFGQSALAGWGNSVPPRSIRVFTDGSAPVLADTASSQCDVCSFAVVFEDDWLRTHSASLPDERHLSDDDIRGVVAVGGIIPPSCARGIFMSELIAIAHALAAPPLSWNVEIVSDSLSSISAIKAYCACVSERRRLRMAGRPLLSIIASLLERKKAEDGQVTFTHQHSHTDSQAENAVGNRVADFVAASVRTSARAGCRSYCVLSPAFPVAIGERAVHLVRCEDRLVIAGDVRHATRLALGCTLLANWQQSRSQSAFSSPAVKPLCELILRSRKPQYQASLLQLVSNTVHWRRMNTGARRIPFQRTCSFSLCSNAVLSVQHCLLECPFYVAAREYLFLEDLFTITDKWSWGRVSCFCCSFTKALIGCAASCSISRRV